MKKFFLTSTLILAALALTSPAFGADVKENWKKHCTKCHGDDGKGKTKMGEKLRVKDYTDAKVQAEMKNDKMALAIREGVKDGSKTRMKAHQDVLSAEEIQALVQYVRDLGPK